MSVNGMITLTSANNSHKLTFHSTSLVIREQRNKRTKEQKNERAKEQRNKRRKEGRIRPYIPTQCPIIHLRIRKQGQHFTNDLRQQGQTNCNGRIENDRNNRVNGNCCGTGIDKLGIDEARRADVIEGLCSRKEHQSGHLLLLCVWIPGVSGMFRR